MPGVFKIKNVEDAEFTLTHPDGVGAVSIASNNIATKINTVLTGIPTAPTATAGNNSTQIATTQYVDRKMTLMTAQNSTSGTAIDFTGIPSWTKRITVMFDGVSTNGSSPVQIQLGDSGGIEPSGYTNLGSLFTNVNTTVALSSTTGFSEPATPALTSAGTRQGSINILNISLNTWVSSGIIGNTGNLNMILVGGTKSLSSTLDRIRITTVNGTDTFDAGQINIMYEG